MSATINHRDPLNVPEKTEEFVETAAHCTRTLEVATTRSVNGLPFTDVTIVLERDAPDGLLRNVRQSQDRTITGIATTSRQDEIAITVRVWDDDEPAYPSATHSPTIQEAER